MALTPGTKLGTFEITGHLGIGGMGEVYRAKDTKLGREVAIKVLPEDFAANAERLVRFEREAKTLASVTHSNIGALHEFREADGIHFLVLELIEGETLADRIDRGPLSVKKTLPLFIQIAEALEAAHENGIVHRDLKPANIKITPEGQVKVLDFGMAKPVETRKPVSPTDATQVSGTDPTKVTTDGTVLGTPSYMSPEQARGKDIDKRSDIKPSMATRFTRNIVANLRRENGLTSRYERLRHTGLLTQNEIAVELDVHPCTIRTWYAHGLLVAYNYNGKGERLYELPDEQSRPTKSQGQKLSKRSKTTKVTSHAANEVQHEA